MRVPTPRRTLPALALAAGLVLAGCGAHTGGGDRVDTAEAPDCAAYAQYGDLTGQTVSVLTAATPAQQRSWVESFRAFESCTAARVVHEATPDLPEQLRTRIAAGTAPDIAQVPGPALLGSLVHGGGAVKPAPAAVSVNVDAYYPEAYKSAGSVDGTLYAAPAGAELTSLVWYSPAAFTAKGHPVPRTFDELVALTDRIVAEGGTPWCAGSGLTGLVGDVLLGTAGPDVYDRWVGHTIPFDSVPVAAALDRVGSLLKGPGRIASTGDGVAGILAGTCALHSGPSSAAADRPETAQAVADGRLHAFELPPVDPAARRSALVAGDFMAAFSDRAGVQALQAHLSSPEWAAEMALATPQGGWTSANAALDPAALAGPVDRLAAETLQDPGTTFRFDAVQLLPDAVGAGSFPAGLAGWLAGAPGAASLAAVEASWPGAP